MSEAIHLLLPMSGQGTRFQKAGFTIPKPMIPISGQPMLKRLLSAFPREWPAHFVMADNHRLTKLPELVTELRPSGLQSFIPEHKKGPGHALLAALERVPHQSPVFVSYCDYGMVWDFRQFEKFVTESQCDACVVCYRGFHAHYLSPRTYAYCRMNGERVAQVREKGSFTNDRESEFASAGGYYFRTANLLKSALEYQIKQNLNVGGELYTSLTVEALLQMEPQAHVRVFEIPAFFQWGTPEDVRDYEYWERTFRAWNREVGARKRVKQLLLPMAGTGSRFADVTKLAKPLIPVNGAPMFIQAIRSMPEPEAISLVGLQSIFDSVKPHLTEPTRWVGLPSTPPGQAHSTLAGISPLDESAEVIVTSCDHAIVLGSESWKRFRADPQCDAAIFTIRGFPGAARRPLAYSYVVSTETTDSFPQVERVSVKKNPSFDPMLDNVLVGTFWLRSVRFLREGIDRLVSKNPLVNGELYLDSVFEIMMDQGACIRMIPLDGYLCWGDPESLAEALYWQEVFGGHRIDQRSRLPGVDSRA